MAEWEAGLFSHPIAPKHDRYILGNVSALGDGRAFLGGVLSFSMVGLARVSRSEGVRVQRELLFVLFQEVLILWTELPVSGGNMGLIEAGFHGALSGIVDSGHSHFTSYAIRRPTQSCR
jgi:hypothetical protein